MNDPPLTSVHSYASSNFTYNALLFMATDLDSSPEHTLTWLTQQGVAKSAGLFDYAVVTVDQADTSISITGSSVSSSNINSAGSTAMAPTSS